MFTGLIEAMGKVVAQRPSDGGARLVLEADRRLEDLRLGESIAVDGVCLTVVRHERDRRFEVDVSDESLRRSTLGTRRIGSRVNLERALRLGDRLGGHLVSGHVDGRGTLVRRERAGGSMGLRVAVASALTRAMVPKGSVAVNGVSLTVNDLDDQGFEVRVIPHTWAETNLVDLAVGDEVNVEVDMLAKMVQRQLRPYGVGGAAEGEESGRDDISLDLLARSGFITAPPYRGGRGGRSQS